MQRVGELLKAEREKKGLSLHEIGMSLKINPKILKAIEDNDSSQLPAKTFLRGFVRSYAQFLKMDVKEVLQQLHVEIGPTRPEEPQKMMEANPQPPSMPSDGASAPSEPVVRAKANADSKASERSKNLPDDLSGLSGSKILTVMAVIVLIVMIIFVAKTVDKYQKESKRPAVEVQESQKIANAEEIPAAQIPATVEAEPPLGVGPTVPHEPLVTPLSGATAHEAHNPSLPAMTAAPPDPVATPAVAVATPTPVPTVAPTPVVTATLTPPPKPVEVIVEALSKVDVKFSFDGEKWDTLVLQADQLHTFKSKLGLKLEVSDGGAVSLIVNGRERGVPGSIGKPIKLSYPK